MSRSHIVIFSGIAAFAISSPSAIAGPASCAPKQKMCDEGGYSFPCPPCPPGRFEDASNAELEVFRQSLEHYRENQIEKNDALKTDGRGGYNAALDRYRSDFKEYKRVSDRNLSTGG